MYEGLWIRNDSPSLAPDGLDERRGAALLDGMTKFADEGTNRAHSWDEVDSKLVQMIEKGFFRHETTATAPEKLKDFVLGGGEIGAPPMPDEVVGGY